MSKVKLSTPMGNLLFDYHRASENIEHVAASALRGERIELRYVKKARADLNKLKKIQPVKAEKEQIQNLVDALDRVIEKGDKKPRKNPARAFSLKSEIKKNRRSKAKKAAGKHSGASSAAASASRMSLRKRLAKVNPGTYKSQLPKLSYKELDIEHRAIGSLISRARKHPGTSKKMLSDLENVRAQIVAEKKARRAGGHVIPISNPKSSKRSKKDIRGDYPIATALAKKYLKALDRYNRVSKSSGKSEREVANAMARLKKAQEELALYAEIKDISIKDLKLIIERSRSGKR